MKLLTLSNRTAKEILRDPLNLFFGLGFPLVLIGLLSAIQANIPVPMFELAHLTPGVTVFGLSFMTLFSAVLISKDRESALLQRLYTAPLAAADFIFGYTLPILPIAVDVYKRQVPSSWIWLWACWKHFGREVNLLIPMEMIAGTTAFGMAFPK